MRYDPTHTLVEPVVQALNSVGVTQEDILNGAIKFTDLDWMAPPLVSQVPLKGLPFTDNLDSFLPWVDPMGLYGFWLEALALAYSSPHKLFTQAEGWRGLSRVMPTALRPSWRKLWLPLPPGLPYVEDQLGAHLSVEVAHLGKLSGLLQDFVHTDSDYYGTLVTGEVIGLKDGMPAAHSPFDIPMLGMVPEFLEMPRGTLRTECEYDPLAKLRSTLWEHRDKVTEFEGLDLACQALRIVTEGKPTMVTAALRGLKEKTEKAKLDRVVIRRCVDLMAYRGVSDARKIEGLYSMLVPAVMTASAFKRDFYPKAEVTAPFVSDKSLAKINGALRVYLMQLGELDDTE